LAKVAVQCSADTFVVNQTLVLRINICGENRHSTTQVLEKYYLDPKVLTAVEISALKVRVFGKK
jgi:hypothetical protein